ncbi:MAG: sigma-70 family RNA polymerase sigma factor [Isosphaeraceae bacterium]
MKATRTPRRDGRRGPSTNDGAATAKTHPALTQGEIARLVTRIAAGDVAARNIVVKAYMHLVKRIAVMYVNRGLTLEDLIGEGNLGLIRAAQGFDPAHGTAFNTYATYWIKEAIVTALTRSAATIRLPGHVSRLLARWRRAEGKLTRSGGEPPTFDEVAAALGLDPSERMQMSRLQRTGRMKVGSLYDRLASDGHSTLAGRTRHEAWLEDQDEQALVLGRLERLGGLERHAVVLRFGLAGESPKSYTDIGTRLGVTKDAVRKMTLDALEKLSRASSAG